MVRNQVLVVIVVLLLLALVVSGCSKQTGSSQNQSPPVSAGTPVNAPSGSYKDISGDDLQKLLDSKEKIAILDVREPFEYQAGHLKAAKLIPLGELTNRLGELDKAQTIVVVCASGARSAQAAQYLVDQGFTKVNNLAGGMMSWQGAVEK